MPADGSVEISVSDTGVGIAPEDQEAVFEEFRQVGTDTRAEGARAPGLGLTLARKFVELHGGQDLGEEPGGAGLDVHVHATGEAMAGELILIVEDNEKNRRLERRRAAVSRAYEISWKPVTGGGRPALGGERPPALRPDGHPAPRDERDRGAARPLRAIRRSAPSR